MPALFARSSSGRPSLTDSPGATGTKADKRPPRYDCKGKVDTNAEPDALVSLKLNQSPRVPTVFCFALASSDAFEQDLPS